MPYQDVNITEEDVQDTDDRMEFAEWLARYECGLMLSKARRHSEVTQEELAQLAKVSQAYVSKIESGQSNPTVGRLAALLGAMLFRLKLDYVPLVPQSVSYTTDILQAVEWAPPAEFQTVAAGA